MGNSLLAVRDINHKYIVVDGEVSFEDISYFNKIYLGKIEPSEYDKFIGDVNGDGKLNDVDFNLLKDYYSRNRFDLPVESMQISVDYKWDSRKDFYYIGESVNVDDLKLVISYKNGGCHVISKSLSFSVPSTATEGRKTFDIEFESLTVTAYIDVKNPTIVLNVNSLIMSINEAKTITAYTSPNGQSVSWTSSNVNVATVSNGKIIAVSEGTAVITAKISNGKSASCMVTVQNKDVPQPDAPVFKLSPSNITARPGGEFTVDLSLNNNPGITSLSLVLDFPTDALTLTKVEYKNLFSSPASGTDKLSSPFYISWFSQLSKDENSNGIIATLTFKVKDEAKKDTYPIGISYDENNVFDSSFTNVKFETKNAQISVSESIPGDVNGDNTVNMKDIVILQQYLNKMSVSINQGNADVNGDNTVNMKDVVLLQQYLNNWDVKLK